MLSFFINFFLALSSKMGYWGVFFLMTIESSFIPFPSEIIIPPAAYLAQKGEFNIYLVVLFGILGSLIGALINYYLAYTLGRKIVYTLVDKKFFKALMLNSKKIEQSEKFFLKYGNISTLIGRLVPVIRQLISLPAGFSKMNLKNFIIYTSIGSGIWTIILACLGYYLGANKNTLEKYFGEIELFFIGIALITFIYLLINYLIKKKKILK
jgi:membrane protein DedA with SNARE-associated domain